jgi:hypothetical protein
LGREERGFSPVAVLGGNGVIMFLEQFGSGMCASFGFLAEIFCFFFWGARFVWEGGGYEFVSDFLAVGDRSGR